MKNNITRFFKGIHTDSPVEYQPKDTYRFILNALNRTDSGEQFNKSTMLSNEAQQEINGNRVPLGSCYMVDGQNCIIFYNTESKDTEIAIQYDTGQLKIFAALDLGMSLNHKVDVLFRIRKGCERTIYITSEDTKLLTFNFDNPDSFKTNGLFSKQKFLLQKTFQEFIPSISDLTISENGQLPSGSYIFYIQLFTEDLNPTEVIRLTDSVIIYNDNYSKEYSNIRGSTNERNLFQDFGITNKSINFKINNIDEDYAYYKVIIVKSTTGSGQISEVTKTNIIPKVSQNFTYTNNEDFEKSTVEEIALFTDIIEGAKHLTQIDNILTVSSYKSKDIDYRDLQRYASKIKTDLATTVIDLTNIDYYGNPKRGTVHNELMGYMPGEIYSFNIHYVFDDYTVSPGFHIPGISATEESAMSKDNESVTQIYDSTNLDWGCDSLGNSLNNQKVRHHRFPFRSDLGLPLYQELDYSNVAIKLITRAYLNITGTPTQNTINLLITYEVSGNQFQTTTSFDASTISPLNPLRLFIAENINPITNIVIQEQDVNGNFVAPFSGINYATEVVQESQANTTDKAYYSVIMGIKFSNIDVPEIIGDHKIIGYYITRAERKESDKTILDTGVLTPLIKESGNNGNEVEFVAHGHIMPQNPEKVEGIYNLIHPEHKFNNKEYTYATELIKHGEYQVENRFTTTKITQDVQPGTSYNPEIHKRRERDSDGFSLYQLIRDTTLRYVQDTTNVISDETELDKIFYLDALFSNNAEDADNNRVQVFNLSSDNKTGFVSTKDLNIGQGVSLPYVSLKRNIDSPYNDFRQRAYYSETNTMLYFTQQTNNTVTLFNGDSYISSMRYSSSMFHDIKLKHRKEKRGIGNFILGGLAILAAVALAPLTGGGSLLLGAKVAAGLAVGASVAALGFGLSQVATGLKKEQLSKVYNDLYEQGLKDTVDDQLTKQYWGNGYTPSDDTIHWFHDIVSNLWFESSVNMNWRMGSTSGITDFLNSPENFNAENDIQYMLDKITTPDSENDDGRNYQAFAKPELYLINKDYKLREKSKIYNSLSPTYTSSKCNETFNNRVRYSLQSFSEELTDNYSVLLPNNYRDIPGEFGNITNTFKISNNFYVHTQEALFHLPQNFQERVTSDIVTFIGSGEYFNLPPRLIVDTDTGTSAGTNSKWSCLKTPHGYFFVCESERVIYKFTGNDLKNLSLKGLREDHRKMLPYAFNEQYKLDNNKNYPYLNNTSTDYGIGFIAVYDHQKDMVFFTKKDFLLNDFQEQDYELSIQNNQLYIFRNYQLNIASRPGWTYKGIIDNKMVFYKYDCTKLETEYVYPELVNNSVCNNSWTLSFSLETDHWNSYHSFIPNFYISGPDYYMSWKNNKFYKHNVPKKFLEYYGEKHPFIIDYISNSDTLQTRILNSINLITKANRYLDSGVVEERFITFNKAIIYNSRQCTGILNLEVKDQYDVDYLLQQINQDNNKTIIDRNEKDWSFNNIRDIRIDYSQPIFLDDIKDKQGEYFIDKVLNQPSLSYTKDWNNLEMLRDKYFNIRLIFETNEDVELVFKNSIENESISFR